MLAHSFLIDSSSKVAGNQDKHKSSDDFRFQASGFHGPFMFFEMRFDLCTLDSGEQSLPFGLLVWKYYVIVIFRGYYDWFLLESWKQNVGSFLHVSCGENELWCNMFSKYWRNKNGAYYNATFFKFHNYLSHIMRKPTKWVCTQRRLRSAWASAQSGQSLCCALNE